MRSIHIVPTIDREASGPSYSVTRLCGALRDAGHPVELAVLEPLPPGEEIGWVRAFPYGAGPRRLGRSPAMKRWLRSRAVRESNAVMHNHSLWMVTNLYAAQAACGVSWKLVMSPRGTLARQALEHSRLAKKLLWGVLASPALRDLAAFHATSEQEYRDIRAIGFDQPVAILPNGVHIGEMATEKPAGMRRVLFLGRIHPIKGIAHLLGAWQAVQGRFVDWELVIAGPDEGGHLARMQTLAAQLGLQRLRFIGPLFGASKMRAYAQADLYVLPTLSENFGMTVAEALAAGTPVVTTRGAPWSGLERERAGWWIEIGADALAAALEVALARSPAELAQMGGRGRDWMARDFSWGRIAENMARFYDWLVNGGEAPPFVRVN